MNGEVNNRFSFGEFELDADRRLLLKRGEAVPLNSKTFDLLLTLAENHGQVISKNDLLDKVWENQFVEENNLTVHVAALRKALGETKNENRFIVTVPGKGYSFVAKLNEPVIEIVVESHRFERIVVEEEIETETSAAGTNGHRTAHITKSRPAPVKTFSDIDRTSKKFLLIAVVPTVLLVGALGYWLYQIGISIKSAPEPFQQATLNRLTSSGKINGAAISPDGKYFVYA